MSNLLGLACGLLITATLVLTVGGLKMSPACPVADGASATKRLVTTLFCNYDVSERPVRNRTANVTVNISLDLKGVNIVEMTGQNELLSWLTVVWTDENLKWNKSDYDGVEEFEVLGTKLWTPNLVVSNTDTMDFKTNSLFEKTLCLVDHWGRVLCMVNLRASMFCEQHLEHWPYDTKSCFVMVSSWSNHGQQLNLQLYYEGLTTIGYMHNFEWELRHVSLTKEAFAYPCCPTEPYISIDYKFTFGRHAALYTISVIGPAFVLAGLTLTSFWARRLTCRALVCLAALLGNAHFLQYVSQHVPANGDTSPKIVAFFRDAMVLNLLALGVGLAVARLEESLAPRWLAGVAAWLRGRGGRPGQMLLGEEMDITDRKDTSLENGAAGQPAALASAPKCHAAATLLDRVSFLVFSITYVVLLVALLP